MVESLDTSGRAVLFAGITVCIALLGMFALGVSFLYGVAIAAAIAVAVHGARRAHPAAGAARLLRTAGPAPRERRALPRAGGSPTATSRRRGAAGRAVLQRRPALFAAGAAGVMLVVAVPVPLDAARLLRRRQRPDRARPRARPTTCSPKGFGPGYNGPLHAGRPGARQAGRTAASTQRARGGEDDRAWPRSAPPRSSPAATGARRGDRRRVSRRARRRTPRPPTCSTSCATSVDPRRHRGTAGRRPRRRPDGDLRGLRRRALATSCRSSSASSCCSPSCC